MTQEGRMSRSGVTEMQRMLGAGKRNSNNGGSMSITVEQNEAGRDAAHAVYVIFVGDIEEKWEEAIVSAEKIMRKAGVSEPDKFILEALDHKGGTPVAEFGQQESLDLAAKDRKFFRVTPGGGGRS
jgi:hypothetical protein